jgi:hypothetical protein
VLAAAAPPGGTGWRTPMKACTCAQGCATRAVEGRGGSTVSASRSRSAGATCSASPGSHVQEGDSIGAARTA